MWFSPNYPPHHEYLTLPPISSSSSGTKRLNGWTGKSPTQVLTHHNQDTKDKWVRLWPGQGVWTLHIALSTLSTINNPFFHYYNRSSFLCCDEEGGDKKVNSACYAGSFVTWPDTTSDTAGALIRTRKCVVWLLVYLIMMINIPERILAMIPLEIVLVVVFCSSVYDNVRPFITYHHPTPLHCPAHSSVLVVIIRRTGDSERVARNLHAKHQEKKLNRRRDGGHSNEVIFQCYIRRTFS